MILTLYRKSFNENSTEGELFIDGKFFCYVIEDKVRAEPDKWDRKVKVYGKTAIPYGTYPVMVTYSNRFKRNLTGIFQVPDFEGIRVHNGTSEQSSAGCPIVSYIKDDENNRNRVVNEKSAMNDLCKMIEKEQAAGRKSSIDIVKG